MSKSATAGKTRRVGAKPQQAKAVPSRLTVTKVGPIDAADVEFGDLTVIVGPQATGKSIFLQTLKLLLDRDHIHDAFTRHSVVFGGEAGAFLGGYFRQARTAQPFRERAQR